MKTPKVSIIVPFYCIEQFAARCIESIRAQTYKNIEIVLVDDDSNDGTWEIIQYYATIDARIVAKKQIHGGLSKARNTGIEIAAGELLVFVDGDDFIHDTMIEYLVTLLQKNSADIASSSYCKVVDSDQPDHASTEGDVVVYDAEAALREMMYQRSLSNSVCFKLYKASLFKNVRFPEGRICEDLATTYKVISRAARIIHTTAQLYYYYQRSSSIIHKEFNKQRMDGIVAANEQCLFMQTHYPSLTNAAANRLFMEAFYVLQAMGFSFNSNQKYYQQCVRIIKKYAPMIARDTSSRRDVRAYARLARITPKLAIEAMKLRSKMRKA